MKRKKNYGLLSELTVPFNFSDLVFNYFGVFL